MTTSTTPDPIFAAYQAGDYATANNLINQAGLTPQDVVSQYNLNSDQAAQVAQNLGYNGDMSNINYGSGYTPPNQNSGIVTLGATPMNTAQTQNDQINAAQTPITAQNQNSGVVTLGATPLANQPAYLNDPNYAANYASQQAQQYDVNGNLIPTATGTIIPGQTSSIVPITPSKDQIASFYKSTMGNTNLDAFGKVAAIAQAAGSNNVGAQQIADATGIKLADAQNLLNSYQTGIGNLAKNITASGQTPTQMIQNGLAAENQYHITDADFAKALGKNTSDVTNFLQPARDVQTQLKSIATDPSVTSFQVQDVLNKINSDPTLTNVYGSQAKTLQAALPTLQFKDAYTAASSGQGSGPEILSNYQKMVDLTNNNPELAAKFAPQMQAVQQALQMSGNGKYISTFETFTGLDKGITSQAQNLPTVTKQYPVTDNDGNTTGQMQSAVQVDTSKLPKGVTANQDDNGNVTYQQEIKTPPGWDQNTHVFANYDSNGQLTGYYSPNPVFPTDANGNMNGKNKFDAVWNADGTAAPKVDTSHGGFLSNTIQDLGPIGAIGLSVGLGALTAGLAGPLTESITGALTGAGMTTGADVLGGALSQGLIRGGASALTGGNFAKGFDTGTLGAGITTGLNDVLPSGDLTKYLTAPVAGAIANSAVNKTNLGQNLINAVESGGLNYGLNTLLPSVLPANMTTNPQLTGIASTLLPKVLQGKNLLPGDYLNALQKLSKGAAA